MHQSIEDMVKSLTDIKEINYLHKKIERKKKMSQRKLYSISDRLAAIDKKQNEYNLALQIAKAEYASADTMYAYYTDIYKKKEMHAKKLRLEVKIEDIETKLAKINQIAYLRLQLKEGLEERSIEMSDRWLSALEDRKMEVNCEIQN